jgi:hypothetical protein
MTGTNRARQAAWAAPVLSLLAMAAPQARAAGAADLYYERALMVQADARCRLFTPQIASALGAAAAQARGAALRGGTSEPALDRVGAGAAARAAATPCASADLRTAADRVRAAFKSWGALQSMAFPGEVAGWRADRTLPLHTTVWRLAQSASAAGDPLTFGLAGRWDEPLALVAAADVTGDEQPYAARLVIRDAARAPEPYLNRAQATPSGRLPLSARTPPRWASLVFPAEARGPAAASLAPGGSKTAIAFRFPAAAIAALADLDPREAVTVELLYAQRGGDTARQAFIEVGDFAAGRAFLAASGR